MDLRTVYAHGPCSLATWFVTMCLLALAVAWLAIVIGRVWAHVRMRRHSRRFIATSEPLLSAGQWAEVVALSQSNAVRRSPIARTVAAGLEIWLWHRERGTDPVLAWQVAQASMRQETDEQLVAARCGLRALLVVGGTATLSGFLAPILGLHDALWGVAVAGSKVLPAASADILDTLPVLTFGLLVGLLALWAAAWLARSAEKMRLEIGRTTTSVLDQLARPSATADRG